MRKGSDFSGLSVAIATPFSDGEIDFARLREHIEFQIEAGTKCICPVGTTGESPTLTHDEHERVIAEAVQIASGRIKVMAGTGSNSTSEAIRLTKWAANEGCDGALIVAPYYNKPTQEGFYQHYRAIAEQVDIPICVYNIPGRSAKNIEPETMARLDEFDNITMVKEAAGSMDQVSQIISITNMTVLSGDDSMTLPMLSVGAEGVVSVVGNIVPEVMINLLNAWNSGDIRKSIELHHKLFPLCRDLLGLATNPIPVKSAMAELGRDTGELRLPMTPLTNDEMSKLRNTLKQFGISPVANAS